MIYSNLKTKPLRKERLFYFSLHVILWRRQWHPAPVLLPGKSHGQRSLVGCSLWGRTESDTPEATEQQQQQPKNRSKDALLAAVRRTPRIFPKAVSPQPQNGGSFKPKVHAYS